MARCHRGGENGAAAGLAGFGTGRDKRPVHSFGKSQGAGGAADVGYRRRNGGVSVCPGLATEDAEMARGAIPFDDEPGVGAGASREARVATEILLRQVQPFRRRIDAGPAEAIPEFTECKQEPECYVGSVSAHETRPGG